MEDNSIELCPVCGWHLNFCDHEDHPDRGQMMNRLKPLIIPAMTPEYLDKFTLCVLPAESGCHEWTGPRRNDGYGRFHAYGRYYFAHRVAWFLHHGRQPDATLVLDHLCRNPGCVNPAHLDQVTMRVNTGRGVSPIAAAITARSSGICLNGHVIAEVGTHQAHNGRTCGQCGRDRVANYRMRRLNAEPRTAA